MNAPEPTRPNALLKLHGPRGALILRLQRYALLGWLLFFVALALHFLWVFANAFTPRPVAVVNESGVVIGALEYLRPSARSDQELLAGAMEFAKNFLSLNSSTIYSDYANAMNMMCPALFATTREAVKSDGYLGSVEAARTRSWLEFASGERASVLVARKDLEAVARLRGTLFVQGAGEPIAKPFDMTLALQIVARNSTNTWGLCIAEKQDN